MRKYKYVNIADSNLNPTFPKEKLIKKLTF